MSNKEKYGEVLTPPSFVKDMIKLLPRCVFTQKNFKWLDPGTGTGNIAEGIVQSLLDGLQIPKLERKDFILENMLHMIEINLDHIKTLKTKFGENANIINDNFLTYDDPNQYDIICGNPPFNFNGSHKVPTASSEISKRNDGETIWIEFTKKAISLLKPNGYLLFVLPSIWLKPDKAKMYHYLNQYTIHKIHTFSNTESNKIFGGEAQTPSCFFLLQKRPSSKEILLYDKDIKKYVPFYLASPTVPIPVFGASVINLVYQFTQKFGNLKVYKTNMPGKNVKLSLLKTSQHKYKNVNTCILNDLKPKLSYRYSDKPCAYRGKPKLIMAHGMYGFPYLDDTGKLGISNRDKYVICDYNVRELRIIQQFLSTKFALYLFESTRYRMKFLERYVFDLIPDIPKLPNLPNVLDDYTLADYFNLTQQQRYAVRKLHRKEYVWKFLDIDKKK